MLTVLLVGPLLPVADSALPGGRTVAPSLPQVHWIAPYSWPVTLAAYPVVVTNFTSGNVGLLGSRTAVVGGGPHGIAVQPGGAMAWVMNSGGSNVRVFDRRLQRLVASIAVGPAPVHAVFSPDGATAYVSDFGGSTVTVVNVATRQAVDSITTPDEPHGLAISPDGRTVYAACVSGGAIAFIDTRTLQVTRTLLLPDGGAPYGVLVSPDGRRIYVTDEVFNHVLAFDATSGAPIGAVAVGARPALIKWIPGTNRFLVANNDGGTISVVDASTLREIARVPTGQGPHGVAATPMGTTCWWPIHAQIQSPSWMRPRCGW
jgi:YVTN family beta-propeller protein